MGNSEEDIQLQTIPSSSPVPDDPHHSPNAPKYKMVIDTCDHGTQELEDSLMLRGDPISDDGIDVKKVAGRLRIQILLSLFFFIVEFLTGMISGSIALIADSYHMIADVMALIVAYTCLKMANKKSKTNTYGWVRAEALGGFFNGMFLLTVCLSIFQEALTRIFTPRDIDKPLQVLWVGVIGLLINVVGLFLLGGEGHGHSHGGGGHGHSHGGGGHGHSHGGGGHGHGHSHKGHDHSHSHADTDGHGHSHGVEGHGHSHGHSHTETVGHGHSHNHADADGHGHSHDVQGHGHSHAGSDGHDHTHGGSDFPKPCQILQSDKASDHGSSCRSSYSRAEDYFQCQSDNDEEDFYTAAEEDSQPNIPLISVSIEEDSRPGSSDRSRDLHWNEKEHVKSQLKNRKGTSSSNPEDVESKPLIEVRSSRSATAVSNDKIERRFTGVGTPYASRMATGILVDDEDNCPIVATSEHVSETFDEPEKPKKVKKAKNVNIHGVYLHLMSDAFGSIIVIITAAFVYYLPHWGISIYLDPVLSLCLASLMSISAIGLVKDSGVILMMITPAGIDVKVIRKDLEKIVGIVSVKDVKVWSLTGSRLIASARVTFCHPAIYPDANFKIKKYFHDCGIHSTTIEPTFEAECMESMRVILDDDTEHLDPIPEVPESETHGHDHHRDEFAVESKVVDEE